MQLWILITALGFFSGFAQAEDVTNSIQIDRRISDPGKNNTFQVGVRNGMYQQTSVGGDKTTTGSGHGYVGFEHREKNTSAAGEIVIKPSFKSDNYGQSSLGNMAVDFQLKTDSKYTQSGKQVFSGGVEAGFRDLPLQGSGSIPGSTPAGNLTTRLNYSEKLDPSDCGGYGNLVVTGEMPYSMSAQDGNTVHGKTSLDAQFGGECRLAEDVFGANARLKVGPRIQSQTAFGGDPLGLSGQRYGGMAQFGNHQHSGAMTYDKESGYLGGNREAIALRYGTKIGGNTSVEITQSYSKQKSLSGVGQDEGVGAMIMLKGVFGQKTK